MSKSEYTVEDFVLDPDFRNWVLNNQAEAKSYWTEFLAQNPEKVVEIKVAREILINLARQSKELSDVSAQNLFSKINHSIDYLGSETSRDNVRQIEMDSWATIQRYNLEQERKQRKRSRISWAAVFVFFLGLGSLLFQMQFSEEKENIQKETEWISFEAPSGTKSSISLEDGSKVHLNSGSKITYPKNFPKGIREIKMVGEAFFEVAKDSLRPFQVTSDYLTTTALGTSFNIRAFPNQPIAVSLLTGKVRVEDLNNTSNKVILNPGEDLKSDLEKDIWNKGNFNQEEILAWMNKILIFKNTPFKEAITQLENWYGVQFQVKGEIPKELKVSGKFYDESLQNILEGLNFSTNLQYKIEGKQVKLTFKP